MRSTMILLAAVTLLAGCTTAPPPQTAPIARVPAAEATFFLPDPAGGWTTARIHGPRTGPAHFTDGRSTTP